MTEELMSYIGRKPCGCVVFATIDRPEYKKDIAREIGKCLRQGLTIERMPVEQARPLITKCHHKTGML